MLNLELSSFESAGRNTDSGYVRMEGGSDKSNDSKTSSQRFEA
jgi:hypothetical protein